MSGHAWRHPSDDTCNLLLRRMPAADRAALRPYFSPVRLEPGSMLLRSDQPIATIYFPEDGYLSVAEPVAGRRSMEVAIIGREGLVGWPALMGCERSSHDAVVRGQGGTALAIPLAPLRAACLASMGLWEALLGFVQSVMVQMARTIAANGEHPLGRRIARWLLMRDDRIGDGAIFVHHGEIADAFNVRRASVTDHLHVLEGERLICCRRGRITIRDRPALEAFSDKAYGPADACRRQAADDEAPCFEDGDTPDARLCSIVEG